MPHHIQRSDYCTKQAADCATAASATTIAEIKNAYVSLQEGWLYLAADGEGSRPANATPVAEKTPKSSGRRPPRAQPARNSFD
jgi:hypothetical protein